MTVLTKRKNSLKSKSNFKSKKVKKNSLIKKEKELKKTEKMYGGSNNSVNTISICKSNIDLKQPITLSNILSKSNECLIISLITFKDITIKIEILKKNIIFKMGENKNMDCITMSFSENKSKLDDYFLNNIKSIKENSSNEELKEPCIPKKRSVGVQNITNIGVENIPNKEVNNFFFDLFDALNIEMNVQEFTLHDSSHLKLIRCKYELSLIKMIESGYGFYNKFGFLLKNLNIESMNKILLDLKIQSELSINDFFIQYKDLKGPKIYIDIEALKSNVYNEYLKLDDIDKITNFDLFCTETTMSSLCNYILKICSKKPILVKEEHNKNIPYIPIEKVIDDINFLIKMIINKKILIGNKIVDLKKIYNEESKMSSFNMILKNFEMIDNPKYNFTIEYINQEIANNINANSKSKKEKSIETNKPIIHIRIN